MNVSELKAKYAGRAIERAGCWLLDVDTAICFLSELETSGLPLNGIEGYWLRDDVLEPSLEHSIYFIGTDKRVAALHGDSNFEKARSFLEHRRHTHLMFDIDHEET